MMKKRLLTLFLTLLLPLCALGCSRETEETDIAATTLPVYEFTSLLCQDTGLTVTRLVTETVSCLHDYSLNVRQVQALQRAKTVVISGAGLEDFLGELLQGKDTIDSSTGIPLLESCHDHAHEGHHHDLDSHIWLSPACARQMVQNICDGLTKAYPQHAETFARNLRDLLTKIDALQDYGDQQLAELSCRQLITFHDGFAYLADAFQLSILEAFEEESGSEASAAELKE